MQKKMPDSYKSTPILAPTDLMRRRMFIWVFLALLVFAGYVVWVLYDIAANQAEYYRAIANKQHLTSYTINANRGTIYDRNGNILAQSTTVWDVIINPVQIREVDAKVEDGKEGELNHDKIELIAENLANISADTVRFALKPAKVLLFDPDTEERIRFGENGGR